MISSIKDPDMNFEESKLAEELLGVDEFLDRYTNPINKQMYLELFSIFIKKEEMDIFTSISEMISNEEQLDTGDISSIINGLTKRAAIAVMKNTYGLITNEELEIRLPDIYDALVKLNFLIDIDVERAYKFKSIIDEREEDLSAYLEILEDLGVSMDFIYNYIEDVDYDFLDAYAKILTKNIESLEPDEDEVLESTMKMLSIVSCLKEVLKDKNPELLKISLARNSLLRDSDIITVVNSEKLDINQLPFELLVGYRLSMSSDSIPSFFKNYTENLTFDNLVDEESCFTSFQDLDNKYKIELAKRMNDE